VRPEGGFPKEALSHGLPWITRIPVKKFDQTHLGARDVARQARVRFTDGAVFKGTLEPNPRKVAEIGPGIKVAFAAMSVGLMACFALSWMAWTRPGRVPVGTICAWPGKLPGPSDKWWEHWRVCDGGEEDRKAGRKLQWEEHQELQNVLTPYGNHLRLEPGEDVKLPDFRNYFLRGKGDASNDLGAPQSWATALWKDFEGDGHFARTHVGVTKGPDTRALMSGQDARLERETRPKNYAVHWIIRVK
jgi:hypothetical protein